MTPALDALLADRVGLAARRTRDQAQARDWQNSAAYRHAIATLEGPADDGAEAVAARAMRLLADGGWVADLLVPLVAALAADPLAEPPFRVQRDALKLGAVLIDHPAASITATILSADALAGLPPAETIVVPGRMTVVRYHRGSGVLHLWRTAAAGDDFCAANATPCLPAAAIALADGLVRRIDGRTHAQLVAPVSDVVTLTANIRAGAALLSREYDRASGRFLRAAALDDWPSRAELMLTFLRHASRAEAAAAFEAASHDPAHFLRWAAMREWLAMDARAALPRLRQMGDDPHPEVRAAARAMIARLSAPCPD
ncbi:hypothetical protein [Sphingomonas sp.]|uniref:hypothetical protein n=1 Tax=Sphingomonas sp. TaxID=28214 RepID=UPI001D7B79AF|nr:hypothetical protein [Sphingomonas sp.]MBX9797031.1 hypothetical protein [Sphingomonas sp.]